MAWALTDVTTGVDLSAYVEAPSLAVAQRAYAETSTLRCRVRDEVSALTIAVDHEILLTDGATKHFAGYVRTLTKTDTGVSGQRIYELACQDYSTLLADDYVPAGGSGIRSTSESDKARITWLFSTFGTRGISIGASVVQLRATMPAAQDFTGLSLHQALTLIASITGGSFFVDYDKVLHYFSSEVNAAPFNLSDAPNGSTTFGYENFSEASDTVEFVNEVHVIGTGVSTTRYLGGSPPAAGTRRAVVVNDSQIADLASAQARGDAVLASYGTTKKPSHLRTYKPGLRAGMTVQVTHAGWGISAVTYRIAGMQAVPGTKDRIAYDIDFGSGPVDLSSIVSGQAGSIAGAASIAAGAAQGVSAIADLSIGGANLIPNSSFEDGSSWVIGANWVIGFTPSGGQLAFAGSDTARAALAAQTAGALVTAKIPVDRNDEYVVSFWHFIRAYTSGSLRMFVKEYDAANALLATTSIILSAADAAWARGVLRFAPAVSLTPPKTAWNAATAKVEVGFDTNGAAATLTADVDGVQLERGEALTAYAPSPGEILAGTIGTTQIADDAITTPKLIASAVTAAKIAAGTITAAQIAAGTITTDRLATGLITLYDEFGGSAIGPTGFAGALADYISSGIYNARLTQGLTSGALADGRTSDMPYWTLSTPNSTLSKVGAAVEASFTALGSATMTSDKVPVNPSDYLEVAWVYGITRVAGTCIVQPYVLWYKADGTASSTPSSVLAGISAGGGRSQQRGPADVVQVPDDAAYAALQFTFTESGTHNAGNLIRLYSASLQTKDTTLAPATRSADSSTFDVNVTSGTFNNYTPANMEVATVYKIAATGNGTYTGLIAPSYGKRILYLMNYSSFTMTLAHLNAGSSSANQFDLPGGVNLVIRGGGSVMLYYNEVSSKWMALGGAF